MIDTVLHIKSPYNVALYETLCKNEKYSVNIY